MNVLIGSAEGLPNIYGKIDGEAYRMFASSGKTGFTTWNYPNSTEGALRAVKTTSTSNGIQGGVSGDYSWGGLEFDASKSNSIYGKSNHVTPVSMAVKHWLRLA